MNLFEVGREIPELKELPLTDQHQVFFIAERMVKKCFQAGGPFLNTDNDAEERRDELVLLLIPYVMRHYGV